jgi:pimeloyl-ACP methyl ester carboxylesterase
LKLRRISILPLSVAFLGSGLGTLFASFLLETFVFRRLVKARPDLFPWNRELNAVSLILASVIGGVVAIRLARSSASLSVALPARLREMLSEFKEETSALTLLFVAGGVAALLWLLQHIVAPNPLTVGWRGVLMNATAAAASGSLLVGRRTGWIAWPALFVALGVGFGTVSYDSYQYPVIIPADRALLRGEVIVPGRRADATHPGVLLVHDQGCHDRNGTWGVNHTLQEIARHLAHNGYAVLRYDKRGCGASSGVFTKFGLEDFSRDAAVAGALLAEQQEVQGQPVFALGHGYGGQAITIAANANPDLFSGLVLLATPASPVSELLRAQRRYMLTALGTSPQESQARLAAVDEWIEGVQTRRYLNYADYFGVRGLPEALQAEQLAAPLPPIWLRQAMAHDQRAALTLVAAPVLILAGEADWRVPPAEAQLLADALTASGRSDWELQLLPGVNHRTVAVDNMDAGFQLEQTDAYAKTRRPVAPQVLDALTDWLDKSLRITNETHG